MVWVPLFNFSDTDFVLRLNSGFSAFSNELLPTPDCPVSAIVLPLIYLFKEVSPSLLSADVNTVLYPRGL